MDIRIEDWGDPVLTEEEADGLTPADLDGFYAAAREWERPNLFFVLLNSLQRYLERGDRVRAARLSFLTAYYLFVPLTPPGSQPLALGYLRQAIALDPREEYKGWLPLIEGGN